MVEIRVALRSPGNRGFRRAYTPWIQFLVGLNYGLYNDISLGFGLASDIRTERSSATELRWLDEW